MNTIGCIDTYDYIEYYEKNFGRKEERLLTKEELHNLYNMCKTAQENKFDFILGFSPSGCSFCLYKTPENEWIASESDERRDGYIYGIFDNIYDACICMIDNCVDKETKEKVKSEFDSKLKEEISDEKLKKFAIENGYYDEYFYDDFKSTIKKMSGIESTDNKEVAKRNLKRKRRFYPSRSNMDYLIYNFIENIARSLNIDTNDLYDKWYYGEIDDDTFDKLKMERINLKEHQDLVLKELEKYNHSHQEEVTSQKESSFVRK